MLLCTMPANKAVIGPLNLKDLTFPSAPSPVGRAEIGGTQVAASAMAAIPLSWPWRSYWLYGIGLCQPAAELAVMRLYCYPEI